jgi:hypothetical protein
MLPEPYDISPANLTGEAALRIAEEAMNIMLSIIHSQAVTNKYTNDMAFLDDMRLKGLGKVAGGICWSKKTFNKLDRLSLQFQGRPLLVPSTCVSVSD